MDRKWNGTGALLQGFKRLSKGQISAANIASNPIQVHNGTDLNNRGMGMKVEAVLTHKGHDVTTLESQATVAQAVERIHAERIGSLVVTDSAGTVQGIFSERDVIRGLAENGAGVLDLTVRDLMTTPVLTCSPDDTVVTVMEMMTRRRIRHIPVVVDGKLLGLISIGDAVKSRIAETELEAEALKEYIATG